MTKRFRMIVAVVLTAFPWCLQAMTVNRLPYEMTFDSYADRTAWTYLNSSNAGTNTWVVAQQPDYAYVGRHMLYMTKDAGISRSYTTPSSGTMRCLALCSLQSLQADNYTLDFHYRGPKTSNDRLYVSVSTNQPASADTYWIRDGSEKELSHSLWWQDFKYTFSADGQSTYYIMFFLECSAGESKTYTGWAIDDIQLYPSDEVYSCTQVPSGLTHARVGNNSVFNWNGNASEYQVQYFMSDTSSNIAFSRDNITTTSFTVRGTSVPEGTYNFRVRSICGLDTSAWAAIDYQLIYDATQHCFDYLDFNSSNVQPEYGWFYCPGCSKGKIDNGFENSSSRHTIHHYPHDFDERTNYKLRTFPKGQPAAVRLGNWETGAQAEDIVYTMQITPDMGVLQLQYALVMQLPDHTPESQPRFTLEFLDENGNLFNNDSCGYVDFTAAADLKAEDGWHIEHIPGEADVLWKDWSLIGLTMRDYVGQTVKIRITTRDCSEGQHFGYAYFTLSCSRGVMEGIHCGVKPESFTVDTGFFYRWYEKYNPTEILGRNRTYILQPMDTATFCVDMINMVDTNCYFTLEASSLAYMTHPVCSGVYEVENCQNWIQLSNASSTDGVYWDESHIKHVVKTTDTVASFYWDFGKYGTSTEWAPRLKVDNNAANLHVTLHTFMDNFECEDVSSFDVAIPAIGTKRTILHRQFCKGQTYSYHGKIYVEEGDYVTDTLTAWTGCDSLIVLSLRYFHTDTLRTDYMHCQSDSPFVWHNRVLTESGLYYDTIHSKMPVTCDCDSVIDILNLTIQPLLSVEVDYEPQQFCNGEGTVEVPFTITSGNTTSYDLLFSEQSKKLGFHDRIAVPIDEAENKVVLTINEDVWAGEYEATLVFHNRHCDTLEFPIPFTVYYDPEALITQRWNDFLSVRKTAYDYYGGFYDYQWFQDGKPMTGQTGSQLYLPDTKLQNDSYYWVELTRVKDSVRMRTCDFQPSVEPDTVTLIITVSPTVLPAQQRMPVHVHSTEAGVAELYFQSGELMGKWAIKEEDNQLYLPSVKGLYLLRVVTDAGHTETRKIIVE